MTTDRFDVLTVVSPTCFGEETKDQDRAAWYPTAGVAVVCDGVSTAPYSGEAAEMAVAFAPVLFNGLRQERLEALADLLVMGRRDSLDRVISFPPDVPPSMQPMVEAAVRERRQFAYQTTLVAARVSALDDFTQVEVIACGDSALFAFSEAGEPLLSSLQPEAPELPLYRQPVSFGPGDELIVKHVGTAAAFQQAARRSGIGDEHASRWLACKPLDWAENSEHRNCGARAIWVRPGEPLFAPSYLLGTGVDAIRRLRFSSAIRTSSCPCRDFITKDGVATNVLPDHIPTGHWEQVHELLPSGAHIVLASDGFYQCFGRSSEMLSWLQRNAGGLSDAGSRAEAMRGLHQHLHSRCGDDDMSFVWIRPVIPTEQNDGS